MKKIATVAVLAALCGVTFLPGCEERATQKKVDVDDGKVKTTETSVTETPGGDVKVEEKKTTEEVDDGKVKTETQTETQTLPK